MQVLFMHVHVTQRKMCQFIQFVCETSHMAIPYVRILDLPGK